MNIDEYMDVDDVLESLMYHIYCRQGRDEKAVYDWVHSRSNEEVFDQLVTLGRVALIALEFQPFRDFMARAIKEAQASQTETEGDK